MKHGKAGRKSGMAKLTDAVEELIPALRSFVPTAEQLRVKSQILSRLRDDPRHAPGTLIDRSTAEYLAGSDMKAWFSEPGFQAWLSNRNEFQEMLEGSAIQALYTLQEVMAHGTQDSAKVNAAKALLELAAKFPHQQQDGGRDNPFLDMTPEQIDAYLASNAPKLIKGDDK